MTDVATATDQWPSLPLDAWRDTQATLHLWTQIVGKVRLARCPWINHSWTATLYVTPTPRQIRPTRSPNSARIVSPGC